MKKVSIIGLGWLGMPLAKSLSYSGMQVVGSKTTPDGVEAARMCGIECYLLQLEPQINCASDDSRCVDYYFTGKSYRRWQL